MNFIERLTQAITDKNIKTVNAMLQALQILYGELPYDKNSNIDISLRTELKQKNQIELGIFALKTDIEIFKSLINFFKKNSAREISKDNLENDINHLHYYAIFTNNLPAIQFLVTDIGVDLLKSSNGYAATCISPLHALLHSPENNDFEIFQFLLPYCIAAYQQAGKDATKTLLDPVIFQLNSLITEQKNKISSYKSFLISRNKLIL